MTSKPSEPPSLLSDDQPQPTSVTGRCVFLVARYNGRAVAIRKSTDFKATLASVQTAFSELSTFDSTQIHLSSRIDGFGEEMIEVNGELWAGLCHHLLNIQIDISVASDVQTIQPSTRYITSTGSHHVAGVKLERIVVRVRDTYGQMDLNLPVFASSTVRALKDLIIAHDRRLPKYITLQHQEHDILVDDEHLHACGVKNNSVITVATEFQVYLVGPDLQQSPATIATFNSMVAIQLIAFNTCGIDISQQILSCDGVVIAGGKKVGEYSQIIPGCRIYVNKALNAPPVSRDRLIPFVIRKDTGFGDTYSCTGLSDCPILDIKALASTKFKTPISGLELCSGGGVLTDNWSLDHVRRQWGNEIRVKVSTNAG